MNALELADELELKSKIAEDHGTIAGRVKKAAEELRRLQAENDALRKEAALQRMSDFTQEFDA
jgi:hypothetical protein